MKGATSVKISYMFITFVICLMLSVPVYAFSGYVSMDYDLLTQDWVWEIELQKNVTEIFSVGTTLQTYCPGYGFKGIVPSWIPEMQRYEVWAEARIKNISVKLIDWCDHYLAQSGIDDNDTHGLALRMRYEF